jgi:hypothetical protein
LANAFAIAGELFFRFDALGGMHSERPRHGGVVLNYSLVPTTLPWVTVWSCTSICQAPLLATTIRLNLVANRRVDLNRIEAERHPVTATTGFQEKRGSPQFHRAPRCRCSRKGRDRASPCVESDTREAEKIAAIGDNDCVI